MDNVEKALMVQEAQKWVDEYYAIPDSPIYASTRAIYGARYSAINEVFQKLTGHKLVVKNKTVIVEEGTV